MSLTVGKEGVDLEQGRDSTSRGGDGGMENAVDDSAEIVGNETQLIHGGFVADGYQSVKEKFMENFKKNGQECSAQVCAYVRGQKVVDLWASRVQVEQGWGVKSHQDYSAGHLQNIFSSTKVLTSLVVAMLVDRGHLKYDQLVTEIWPEYGQNGKEKTTVTMVMRHEAGLPGFRKELAADLHLTTEQIKANKVGEVIEKLRPIHEPGTKRMYHAVTRGWIVNEIVRRADPQGRTIGEFLQQEIAIPLGIQDELHIGVPEEHFDRISPLTMRSNSWTMRNLLLPKALGGGNIVGAPWLLRIGLALALPIMNLAWSMKKGPPIGFLSHADSESKFGLHDAIEVFNSSQVRAAELPSANGHASARAIAAVANAIVQRGNDTILSQKGKTAALGNPDTKKMSFGNPLYGTDFTFTDAGLCEFGNLRRDFTGWMGLGGSSFNWHEEEQVAIGYCMNALELIPWNARSFKLQAEVLKCAKRARSAKL